MPLIAYPRAQADVVVAALCLLALVTALHQRQVYLHAQYADAVVHMQASHVARVTHADLIIANMAG